MFFLVIFKTYFAYFLLYFCTGHRGNQEARQLRWGDIKIAEDEYGRFLQFRERTTKTRQGENGASRDSPPRAYENSHNPERCPVRLYEIYRDCRPEKMCQNDSPFYLAVNNMIVDPTNRKMWFKCGPIGKNALGEFMKKMSQEAGINGKFANHTARKTSITNLLQAGMPPTLTKNISGH